MIWDRILDQVSLLYIIEKKAQLGDAFRKYKVFHKRDLQVITSQFNH